LKDLKYFQTTQPSDANDVEGIDLDDGEDSDNDAAMDPVEDDDEIIGTTNPVTDTPQHFGEQILEFWNKQKQKLITPLLIAGWFFSPEEVIRLDVIANSTAAHRLELESVIAKNYFPIWDEDLGEVLQTFWRQFDAFQTKKPLYYSRPYIWKACKVEESAQRWHKYYSSPNQTMFGYVACHVTLKPFGCGGAKRTWGAFKHLKNGKRLHMSAERSERQAAVYGAVCIEKGQAACVVEEKHGAIVESKWTEDDIAFQNEVFDAWVLNNDLPIEPKRLLKIWTEDDWEWACIEEKKDVRKEAFLRKYTGMQWMDNDELMVARSDMMEWQGGRSGSGWSLIGKSDRDGQMQLYIPNKVIDLIAEHVQPIELNVELVINGEKRAKNTERLKIIMEEKKTQAVEKRKSAELRKLMQL
jgi:hypothetical protein